MNQTQIKNLVNADTKTIDEYMLLRKPYKIPYSQRNYEWGKNEIIRLFNDVYKIFTSDDENDIHMLNVVTILTDDDGDLLIYDGQQRTITCLLLLAAIARKAKNIDKELSDELTSDYIYKNSVIKDKKRKITFDSDIDTNFFYDMVNRDKKLEDLEKEKTNLSKNSNRKAFINGYLILVHELDKYEWTADSIEKFVEAFINNCFLVELLIGKQEIAEKMFETLNNTGKDLEKYYVLKNDIVRKLGEDKVREKWDKIDYNLSNVSHNKFLRNFAQVMIGPTSEKKSLDNIYKKYSIDNEESMEKLLENLYNASECYSEIVDPSKYKGVSKETVEYQETLYYLKAFRFQQHSSILLAMLLKHYSLKDINRVLKAILVLVVRNFYFLEKKTNYIVGPFSDFSKEIYSDEITIDDLISNIYSYAEKDELVKNAIIERDYSKRNQVRALLIILYNNGSEELKINNEKVDLEHILPRNPQKGGNWDEIFGEEHDKYVYKLGNLTLWFGKKNRRARNGEFIEKQKDYKSSKLEENKNIAKNDRWTEKEINKRTKKMAGDILKVLKINK